MTKNEAIEIINKSDLFWCRATDEEVTALTMAIEALTNQQEQPEVCKAYGSGTCCYPIEACCECPKHEYYKDCKNCICELIEAQTGEWEHHSKP